jgi:hypothetical protein
MDDPAQRPSYQQVKAMIKQFTGQANTLVIPRVFIDLTGDHLAAMLLSQVLYWSDKTDDAEGWFYKTADEWQAELGMSNYQVKRAAAILETFGVETRVRKVKKTPKMHYRIDMPFFINLFLKFLENQEASKSRSYAVENQETSKSMEVEETSKSYKEHRLPEITNREGAREKKDPHPRPLSELALAIADVCKINPKIPTDKQKRALNATYQALKGIGATPADVRARETWWYANDWRAKKEGRAPRPDELQAIWEEAATPIKKQATERVAQTAGLSSRPAPAPDAQTVQQSAATMLKLRGK